MLIDLQGAAYNVYDPEIATLELQSAADQELFSCAGNSLKVVVENFKKNHKCGVFLPFNGAKRISMTVS